jgi:menaquinone-dependent protoporphyrinogen oxidase
MTVLVTAASRHGSTMEIAERIGQVLAEHGVPVDVRPAANVTTVDGYEAVVLGSAVYMGHWLEAARQLAETESLALSQRPLWLFSSGPVGDPPKPDEQPVDVGAIVAATDAREHRVFAGILDRDRLGFAERAMTKALRAPVGDFRDWAAIDAWASHIAAALRPART